MSGKVQHKEAASVSLSADKNPVRLYTLVLGLSDGALLIVTYSAFWDFFSRRCGGPMKTLQGGAPRGLSAAHEKSCIGWEGVLGAGCLC
ncbi:hypothetical protein BDZ91DRAFT_714626 [Kalaharituber pfeilii]|nr:hypothetical protein BDZ91DRAFT_714626 [Kalaharituber pfeilii]